MLPYFTTFLISLPAYMFLPYTAQFLVGNVGITQTGLGTVYLVAGICSTVALPFIGRSSDRLGKCQTFIGGSIITAFTMVVYINLHLSPVWIVCVVTGVMYAGLLARSVPATALMTAVPSAKDRGAFMSINSAMQQIGGGISSVAAGYILTRRGEQVVHFDVVGYICIGAMALCGLFINRIYKKIVKRQIVKELNNRLFLLKEATNKKMVVTHREEVYE